ncbi:Uncharacterised protein [Chlamydia trachomatis]|nr:Uncharacterised protein [Chlamydia trachomatis]
MHYYLFIIRIPFSYDYQFYTSYHSIGISFINNHPISKYTVNKVDNFCKLELYKVNKKETIYNKRLHVF